MTAAIQVDHHHLIASTPLARLARHILVDLLPNRPTALSSGL
jgi:hypothetical protein